MRFVRRRSNWSTQATISLGLLGLAGLLALRAAGQCVEPAVEVTGCGLVGVCDSCAYELLIDPEDLETAVTITGWSVDDADVASIDTSGILCPEAIGTVNVYCTYKWNDESRVAGPFEVTISE